MKSSNFAIRSPVFSREKSMPTVITTTTITATGQEMTEPILTPTTTEEAEMQLHAGSTMERIKGKIVPTTGETRTVAMTIPEVTLKLPILLSKTPVQEGELKEKSKAQRINDPPTDPQRSVSTTIAKPTTNPRAAVMPHAAS